VGWCLLQGCRINGQGTFINDTSQGNVVSRLIEFPHSVSLFVRMGSVLPVSPVDPLDQQTRIYIHIYLIEDCPEDGNITYFRNVENTVHTHRMQIHNGRINIKEHRKK
jgi:hypothetical protein